MTAPLTARIADRFIRHAVNLQRVDAGLRGRALRVLRTLERDLMAQLAQSNPTGPTRTDWQTARLNALLDQTSATIATTYKQLSKVQRLQLSDFAEIEGEYVVRTINGAVGVPVVSVVVPDATLRAVAGDALIEGHPASDWWGEQGRRLQRALAGQLRQGVLRGESMQDLARRVRGRRENRYADGLVTGDTKAARRDAMALVRTSVQAVSNAARDEVYGANQDLFRGYQHMATLDPRTCPICQPLDGAAWDVDGDPLPDSPYQGPDPGRPPLHWNCRCVRIPVLKSAEELAGVAGKRAGAAIDKLAESTRASMDGQVSGKITYEQWLASKDAASPGFADEILGKGKAGLWRTGKLSLGDMVDQSGRPMSLKELRAEVGG